MSTRTIPVFPTSTVDIIERKGLEQKKVNVYFLKNTVGLSWRNLELQLNISHVTLRKWVQEVDDNLKEQEEWKKDYYNKSKCNVINLWNKS
jgi:hypothetical protein